MPELHAAEPSRIGPSPSAGEMATLALSGDTLLGYSAMDEVGSTIVPRARATSPHCGSFIRHHRILYRV